LAFSDDRVAALDDLGVRAAAIAAAGPGVALVARLPGGSTDELASLARHFVTLAAPPMAAVMVTARADVALAVGANGVILRQEDLDVNAVRGVLTRRHDHAHQAAAHFILRSVHSESEAAAAVREGADALVVGTIWSSATHIGRAAAGTGLLERVVSMGVPTYAIGGVTPARAVEAKAAGAWGVAAISAFWDAAAPYRAAMDLLEPWFELRGEGGHAPDH
jgi:thiamine-phosphate pyrophosphorylase